MPTATPPELTPAQQRTLADLGAGGGDRPVFPSGLRERLRSVLEAELAPVLGDLGPDELLTLSKHLLSQVHGCEARFLAELDAPFVPSVPIVRGTVAHKAIELGIHWRGEPIPLELVDEAIARLTESDLWMAGFLQGCTEAELAELRASSGDRVSKFFECFPPLKPVWRPVTESSQYVELLDARVVLRGKVDLTLGTATASELGNHAGKVVIDLKTGAPNARHRDDLRFYALLDTLRLGVPPRLVASFYLDLGEAQTERVTEAILDAAAARTVDGAKRMAALQTGAVAPVYRPSFGCRWCPALGGCDTGARWLTDEADADDGSAA
ncbi:MAG TPA: PD-(D/E)XK nuclease family protein [Acidimicrobiales bacterium]|nr:PD-(D/E)XK nuclease family protein [Acidimicrobiales bacterium]